MRNVLQDTKALVVVLVLMWLVAACGGASPTPAQASPTTVPSAMPSPAASVWREYVRQHLAQTTVPSAMPSPAASQATVVIPTKARLIAVLSQVEGDVTVVELNYAGEQSTRLARPMQRLSTGAMVHVPAGAHVGLLCSSGRWVELAGEVDWQLTEKACNQGVVIPAKAGLIALLSQVEGDVTVVELNYAGKQSTRPARPGQVLSTGAMVHVPAGAHVGLLCSSDRWVDLAGEVDWQLTEAACDQGHELPSGTFQEEAPQAGRILDVDFDRLIEFITKSGAP